ncbi:MAG TPA: magnesium transporter [Chromatiaceae bacterium]|jgi:magnesium transporter|nr:magnesium transporter [Chromatiaceae bacterium]HIB83724.1 magnesium transporter [Chromatiaceae bacterium]HIN83029.1 magnesium transporter [Chromatiales bacterium]HIO14796.1 magnesium transporter [Chromatiales bacterium]HIO54347.1 magnesium transporter [Chromatiales bacterium]
MPHTTQHPFRDTLHLLTQALEAGTLQPVRGMLNNLYPAEISKLLESLPPAERSIVWELVEPDNRGDVLVEVSDEVRAGLIKEMGTAALLAATEGLETDDLADILQDLPNAVTQQVLHSMGQQDRGRLESVLSYDEDSAGGLMNIDTITVRTDVTLDVVLRYLRLRGDIPEQTDSLIVVSRNDQYLGVLPLSLLLTTDPSQTVAQTMTSELDPIRADMPATKVANLFEHRDLISAPVVSDDNRLLGRITIDDVVDVIRDEGEHSLMSMAGLDQEDDMFAPILLSTRRRGVWLGLNLLTAILASAVIGLFEATLDKIVVLAVLMPIIASMGGIAGSQTLILMIRGLAMGQTSEANARWLLFREISVGLLNGVIWAGVMASVVTIWFGDVAIGAIMAAALIVNLGFAALAGVSIPLIMKRLGIDPAIAGNVILTTVTDVVGFFVFLGLATIFLV